MPNGSGGYLVVDGTGPALARTVWGDAERYRDSYWARFAEQGYFFSGDGAKYDADGDIWVLGRVDDVINVSGHRLSTIEIESALVAHPSVGEAGVVGVTDPVTGQAVAAFVIPSDEAVDRARDDPPTGTNSPTRCRRRSASTSRRRSARSPSPATWCSCPTSPRPARARSCGACSATSATDGRSET